MAVITEPPWPPAPTPSPHLSRLGRLHRQHDRLLDQHSRNWRRQDQPLNCDNVGNEILSCSPVTNQTVLQNTTMHFVWNKNEPSFAQFNRVDVYLFHQDTLTIATSKKNLQNQMGRVAFDVNDQWWGERGDQFVAGHNSSYPMYFIIVPGNHTLDGGEIPQATFTALQTRVPDSILAQQIASSTTVAAVDGTSPTSLSNGGGPSPASTRSGSGTGPSQTSSGSGTSGLQSNSGQDSFPKWAIALLVILGALALLAFVLASYFFVQRMRLNKNRGKPRPDSIGSSTPIMASVNRGDSQRDPLMGAPVTGGEPISPAQESSQGHSFVPPPGVHGEHRARSSAASITTRDTGVHEGAAPFSGADAAIMAAAFRDTLRKPDFADRPLEEGESPEGDATGDMLERELAEEGRDIRSVSSSRVRVEGDHGTIQAHRNSDLPSVDSG